MLDGRLRFRGRISRDFLSERCFFFTDCKVLLVLVYEESVYLLNIFALSGQSQMGGGTSSNADGAPLTER